MPKNVGTEVHLKDSEVSQTFSNYTVLKMSEQVAAGRSCEIALSSSVKWSSCPVSFFGAVLWNTASSNLKVKRRIRQRVLGRKAWPFPFDFVCRAIDKKRWKMTLWVCQHTFYTPQLCAEGWRGTLRVLCRNFTRWWGLVPCTEV